MTSASLWSAADPARTFPAGYFEHARPEVAALVPSSARNVIDVGCGAGVMGQALKLSRPGLDVRGIENDAPSADRARLCLDDVALASAEAGLPAGWLAPDCVIFADVLEHLADPWATLRRWREAIAPGGVIILSLPNVLHRSVIGGLLRFRWDYQQSGILDRTHLRFFTRATALELMRQAGLRVTRLERCMDGQPLGGLGLLLLWRRRRQERAGKLRLSAHDPVGLLADLYTTQFLLVGE